MAQDPSSNTQASSQTNQARVEHLAEVGTLVGHLAHEIRNPLSTIKINLQLLAEDIKALAQAAERNVAAQQPSADSPAERLQVYRRQLRKLDTVTKEADRLATTLTDFLNYTGNMELHLVTCDLNELVEELIDFYEPQAVSRNVQMRHSAAASAALCRIDPQLIKQALLNLFINATQAMEQGGELIVRCSVENDYAVVDIIDTGPGIDDQLAQEIFAPYFTTRSGGTGLGLPTCRRIIEAHHGRIEVQSEVGKGTDFRIMLPLQGE